MNHRIPTGLLVAFDKLPDSAFVRLNQLLSTSVIPFSAATAWRRVREGTFPQPVRVSPQVTAWRVGEIRQWLKCPGDFTTQRGQKSSMPSTGDVE
jgi:predicted DNA-binding transcriptional regulator AlpA